MSYRICSIISSLSVGGAQMMLFKLMSRFDRTLFSPEVVVLTRPGGLSDRFSKIGIPVTFLGMRRGIPDPSGLLRLVRHLRESRPDLVQTWMYHADLLGGLASILAGGPPVIWNIRHSNLDSQVDKATTILTARICALASRSLPARIVCCAGEAVEAHARMGYTAAKMQVIPNGFDLEQFRPDHQARADLRRELGIAPDALVIGYVSRYHPQKDHRTFIHAAANFLRLVPKARFVLCGDGITGSNRELSGLLADAEVGAAFHLLGRRDDIPRLTAAFDIATLSSACGEAFSNTVGEAMACAIPCVVTDVGDSSAIVGETGIVVPPRDPAALSQAWHSLESSGAAYRQELGQAARRRAMSNFSINRIVGQYQDLYLEALSRQPRH